MSRDQICKMLPFVETDSEGFPDWLKISEKTGHLTETEKKICLLTTCHLSIQLSSKIALERLARGITICDHSENLKTYTNVMYHDFIIIFLIEGMLPFAILLFLQPPYPERVTVPRKAFP